jgi:Na+-transporting methylmalonyl-CoA/oxaloacetate decarboxylase gamma subunit
VLNALWFVLSGMAMVFATLGLLIAVITVLKRWLPPDA